MTRSRLTEMVNALVIVGQREGLVMVSQRINGINGYSGTARLVIMDRRGKMVDWL